jgi:hypothetical protein
MDLHSGYDEEGRWAYEKASLPAVFK